MSFCDVLECASLVPCPIHRDKRVRESEDSLTLENVQKHITKHDCWLIINGSVYDVTNFLTDHPAGPEILLDFAGKDATELFERVGHGAKARRMMQSYCLGPLVPSTPPSASSSSSSSSSASSASPSSYASPSKSFASPSKSIKPKSFITADIRDKEVASIPGLYYVHDFLPPEYAKNLTNLLRHVLDGKGSYQGISHKQGPKVSVFTPANAPPWLVDVLAKYNTANLAPPKPTQVSVNMYPSSASRMVPHKDGPGVQAIILTLENSAVLRFWPKKESFPIMATAVYDDESLTDPHDVLLMPGSLLIMTGEAYFDWVHAVEPADSDTLREVSSPGRPSTANFAQLKAASYKDGETFPRGPRISVVSWFE